MMIEDLLVYLAPDRNTDGTVDYAISLALAFDAHLAGAAFACNDVPPHLLAIEPPQAWIDDYRKQSQDAAKSAVERFEAAAKRAGISAQAGWLSTKATDLSNLFARITRRFDLSVVPQPESKDTAPARLVIEAALFETGRPTLIVPQGHKTSFKLDRAMIGWDGSPSAARAVADSMPFLKRAKTVELVAVTERGRNDQAAGADIVQHLARHGLAVEVREIVAPHVKVANVLLSHAAETSAHLLVLGGYGHSRLREFVLGGVTRSVLAATTIPTLMSH